MDGWMDGWMWDGGTLRVVGIRGADESGVRGQEMKQGRQDKPGQPASMALETR